MRLAIVGTGHMAGAHARAFAAIPGVQIVAAAEIDPGRRAAFAAEHAIARSFASVEEALDWGGFDAVANVTPDQVHHATTLPCLAAGKHVFCEKPLATNRADAEQMAAAAARAGVVNMVNLTYRNVAALQRGRRIVAEGQIGAVRHVEASYLQSWLTQGAWGDWRTEPRWLWRLSTAHGSHGTLGDIGIHVLDFACYAAGLDVTSVQGRLATFDKAPGGRIGDYVLDANDSFALTARLDNGALAAIHASRFASGHHNDLSLRIHGTEGGIEITNAGPLGTLRCCIGAQAMEQAAWTDVTPEPVPTNYRRFAEAVAAGRPADPGPDSGPHSGPDFVHAARLQAVLDAALQSDRTGRAVDIG